ncbi:MAG: hypothetical protein PF570_03625 [Candidatus Cloacimonetes bacterium]|jgi:hypothetical protein|nr:hypothetical protein [Candidatus Cloacimonadota bacterium]
MKLFIIILLLCCTFLSAIDLHLPLSAVQNATSGLVLIYPTPSAASSNAACSFAGIETSATYLFSMEDLPFYNFHVQYKYRDIGFHIGNSFLAHPLYKESSSMFTLNYAYHEFTVGSSVRYLYNMVEEYHEDSALLVDMGLIWNNNSISTGLSVRNITHSQFLEEKLPIVYLWESCFYITDKSWLSVGLEKETDFDFAFKIAGRYDVHKVLTVLSSYQYEPDRIGIGAVFNLKDFSICYSVRTHQYLSLNHYISLNYAF